MSTICFSINRFVQKSDCGFSDFSRTKLHLFPYFSRHFVHLYANKKLTKLAFKCRKFVYHVVFYSKYRMGLEFLNSELQMLWVMNCKKINKCTSNQQCHRHLHFPGQRPALQFSRIFPAFSRPMIIFCRLFKALKISTINSRTFHTFAGSVRTLINYGNVHVQGKGPINDWSWRCNVITTNSINGTEWWDLRVKKMMTHCHYQHHHHHHHHQQQHQHPNKHTTLSVLSHQQHTAYPVIFGSSRLSEPKKIRAEPKMLDWAALRSMHHWNGVQTWMLPHLWFCTLNSKVTVNVWQISTDVALPTQLSVNAHKLPSVISVQILFLF